MKIEKKCDVCNNFVHVDQWGNGKCPACGWYQNRDCVKFPKVANPPNFISLNKAKRYYRTGKKFLPTYIEFIKLIERGFDFTFKFLGKSYQVSVHDDYTIWEVDTENYQVFKNIKEFKSAQIEGALIKENWEKIKCLRYDC